LSIKLVSSKVEIMPSQFVIENNENIHDIYSFKNEIGAGSFAVVYKAIHKVTQKVRAIKRIMKDRRTKGVEKTLLQEIAILKSIVIFQ